MVVGAPGSGKTSLLIERAAFLVENGLLPDQVLVLGPSRRQATLLRDLLSQRIPRARRGAWAQSVASFAFQIVRADRAQKGLEPPRLRSAADVDRDIAELLRERDHSGEGAAWPEWLNPTVRATETFRTELRELMARLVEWGVSPHRLREWASSHHRPEWSAAADFIDDYRLVIARARPNDFDPAELVGLAVSILRDAIPEELRTLQVVLVDDLHDLPPSVVDLLDALRHSGIRITATADPDSASQTFRGSTPDLPAIVADRLGVEVEILDEVYRHGPAIRHVVNTLSERIGTARGGRQRAVQSAADRPEATVWSLQSTTPQQEAETIASVLQSWQETNGWSLDDMAVIVRSSSSLEPLLRALWNRGIPAYTPHREPLSTQLLSRTLCSWMRAAVAPEWIQGPIASTLLTDVVGAVDPATLRRIRRSLRDASRGTAVSSHPDTLLADFLAGREVLLDLPDDLMPPLTRARDHLVAIAELAATSPVDVVVSRVWERLGQERLWVQQATGQGERARFAHAALDSGIALVETARRFTDTSPDLSLREFCERVLGADVAEDVLVPPPGTPAVWLATPSAMAGVEKKAVVLASLNEGLWPNTRVRGTLLGAPTVVRFAQGIEGPLDERKLVLDDEMRMAVLAASRATSTLVVSAVESEESRPSPLWYLIAQHGEPLSVADSAPTPPTRVLSGQLRAELVAALQRGDVDATAQSAAALAFLARSGAEGADPSSWWGLQEPSTSAPLFVDDEVSLSPSRLATLERSALHWLLDLIAPEESTVSMGVGTLIHRAWERFPSGTADQLMAEVTSQWSELDFDAPWVSRQQHRQVSKWVAALSDYGQDRLADGVSVLGSEQRFELVVEGGRLRGVVDRIERTASGATLVVDLKTGLPIRAADVAEHPQLQAYQTAILDSLVRSEWGLSDEPSEGAALLYIRGGVSGKSYRVFLQPPLDGDGVAAFRARLEAAIAQVRADQFEGHFDLMGRPGVPPPHRSHQVGQVCGD